VTGYKNLTEEPKWQPVTVPTPQFSGPDEVRRWSEATRLNPRKPGESALDWMDRIVQAAKAERDPGEEG
jgi:hypothetical protein